eukprot:GHRR01034750.1.p1 GENE.GHRR01034750.1~~GHRR01034750.1.p1  ORF type:complete len:106 (-),score=27.98 GHRR01034750.1:549-866(-)
MGGCLSKPEPEEPKPTKPTPAVQPAVVQEAADQQNAATPPVEAINILPAGGAASVSILPPWVNHTELDISRKPSSSVSAAANATNMNDPAANALRSNLSEVRGSS